MRAIVIEAYGGPEVVRLAERDPPRPVAGEVLVKLERAGLNFIDVHMRFGRYARSDTYRNALPMVIGMEGAGTVVECGADVTGFAPGDRVSYCISRGSFAEYAAVPAAKLVKVPPDIDLDTATALMLQGFTAHYLSHSTFPLAPGHVCLVHAAAGGAGGLLVQLAKIRGATVIGTAGSPEKVAIARAHGADHVIPYRECDFREEVLRLTEGRGVDVAYDSVGRDTIARSICSLRRRGLCVNYGGASGLVASVEPLELGEAGSVFFTRPHLADYIATPEELRGRADDLFRYVREGRLKASIDQVYPLSAMRQAMEYLEAGRTRGKILLDIHA